MYFFPRFQLAEEKEVSSWICVVNDHSVLFCSSIICLCTFIFKNSQNINDIWSKKFKRVAFWYDTSLIFTNSATYNLWNRNFKSVTERLRTTALPKREGAIELGQKDNKASCCIATEISLTEVVSARNFVPWQVEMISNILGFLLDQFFNFLAESLRDSARKFQNWSCKKSPKCSQPFLLSDNKISLRKQLRSAQYRSYATKSHWGLGGPSRFWHFLHTVFTATAVVAMLGQ